MKIFKDFFKAYFAIKYNQELDYISKLSRRIIYCIIFLFFSFSSVRAINIITYTVSDNTAESSEELKMRYKNISNANDVVRISFILRSANTPFTIYKAEWENNDSILSPIEPFSLIARTDEVDGKTVDWHISLDFPFSDTFNENDVLILNTDKGIVMCPTSREGQLKETIDILRCDYEKQIDISKKSSYMAWVILTVVLGNVCIIAGLIIVIVRRRFIRKRKDIENLSLLIAERTNRNIELETKVDALYGSRLNTLNMLCNEYFEKNESEKMKITLFNEVEKHILALRDSKNISELEDIVNTFLDNIMVKVREQLPELNRNDLTFLIYLYAGFSPRAVCVFTDIKIKNFYNRRSRLKERILASGAKDRAYFVSKM